MRMIRQGSRRWTGSGLCSVAAVFGVFAFGVPAVAAARPVAQPAAGAFGPPLVHLPNDQVYHPGATNEWWYVVGHLDAPHRKFGFQVDLNHLTTEVNGAPLSVARGDMAITDITGQRFYSQVNLYPWSDAKASTKRLDVRLPNGSIAGPMDDMRVRGTLPEGGVDLRLRYKAPPIHVGGRGKTPFGDGYSYYYSLPRLEASGTVTLNGRRYPVSGLAWLDHQWGRWKWSTLPAWIWTPIQLDNGVSINAVHGADGPSTTATMDIVLPSGKLEIVTAKFTRVGKPWVSPTTGISYARSVRYTIPSQRTRLTVTTQVLGQELDANYFEGASTVSGTYRGKPVHGLAYMEQTNPG